MSNPIMKTPDGQRQRTVRRPTGRLGSNFFASLNARIHALASQGADVIRLDIGSPDLPPATHIVEALTKSAARADAHGYQPHTGTAALREAWLHAYQEVHNVRLAQENLLPLLGSKEGIFHISQALLDRGDAVLVPDPAYMTYRQGALFAGAQPVSMPLLPENGFLPDLAAIPLQVARRARMMWLNYPNNPTTAVADQAFLTGAVEFCQRHGILLCHDAAYARVTYDGYRAPSILEINGALETAIEFNSLSKSHNMAGWRTGVVAGNAEAIADLLKLKTHTDSGQFLPIAEAAAAALTGDQGWVHQRNQVYQYRRDLVVPALREAGLQPRNPRATIYVWVPVPEGWPSSEAFARALLENAHVSLTPGAVFGESGEGSVDRFVRISLTQSLERLEEAMGRVREFCSKAGEGSGEIR